MNTTRRILGEAERPPKELELTDPFQAYFYASNIIKGRFPEGEAALATSPGPACIYAYDIVEGPFPAGEAAIATNPYYALLYARWAIKGRFPEGESAIAKNPEYSKQYLKEFPEAKMDWFANRWIDWTQL